jgi:hypothetical protein
VSSCPRPSLYVVRGLRIEDCHQLYALANIRMLSKQRYSILFVFVRVVAFAKHDLTS